MGRRLAHTVYVDNPDGSGQVAFGPDSKSIPSWAKIGDHAYESAASDESGGTPAKAGRGSGKNAWLDYAAANNVEIDGDATRDDIIDALDAAGVPTE